MAEVTVVISPNGEKVDVDAEGFTGGACEDFMWRVMEALGTIKEKERKPEFFQQGGPGVHVGA